MVVLYIETNFLMSVAKGQDPQADSLLQNTPSSVRLAIPGICYMEALSIYMGGGMLVWISISAEPKISSVGYSPSQVNKLP